jgi:hypothetical protein
LRVTANDRRRQQMFRYRQCLNSLMISTRATIMQNFLPGLPNGVLRSGDSQPMLSTMSGG